MTYTQNVSKIPKYLENKAFLWKIKVVGFYMEQVAILCDFK